MGIRGNDTYSPSHDDGARQDVVCEKLRERCKRASGFARRLTWHFRFSDVTCDIIARDRPLSPDEADDMVLDVAINGNADAVVSNNTKHFREPAERFQLDVMTPAELLGKFRKRS
jgi:predicted nucleic acid-binding protein